MKENSNTITIEVTVNAPLAKVWEYWNKPKHIVRWAFASADWEASSAENDVWTGGKFKTRMQAKDKSAAFDFIGTYTNIKEHGLIEYDMDKAKAETRSRHVTVEFLETPEGVKITETFDPEKTNPLEMQRSGWQAILDNFKKYVETIRI